VLTRYSGVRAFGTFALFTRALAAMLALLAGRRVAGLLSHEARRSMSAAAAAGGSTAGVSSSLEGAAEEGEVGEALQAAIVNSFARWVRLPIPSLPARRVVRGAS